MYMLIEYIGLEIFRVEDIRSIKKSKLLIGDFRIIKRVGELIINNLTYL